MSAAEPGGQAVSAICGGPGLALPDASPPAPPEGGFCFTAFLLIFLTTSSIRALPLPSIRALPWPFACQCRRAPLAALLAAPPPPSFPHPCLMALRNAASFSYNRIVACLSVNPRE